MRDLDHAREIRARLVDPAELCAELGLVVGRQRQARGVFARCPWHNDEHPSCSIRVARDGTIAARCHSCGATGDALSLIAAVRGLDVRRDFRAVLVEAAGIAGYDLPNAPRRARRRPLVPIAQRLAVRIDQLADDWLAGRRIRDDAFINAATPAQIGEAFAILDAADELEQLEQERAAEIDRRMDELADAWEFAC